jgi:hypothetical protein
MLALRSFENYICGASLRASTQLSIRLHASFWWGTQLVVLSARRTGVSAMPVVGGPTIRVSSIIVGFRPAASPSAVDESPIY